MKEADIKQGDKITVTSKVSESAIYPWVKEGVAGVVEHIFDRHPYPFQVKFEGDFVVDPRGCPTIVKDPLLLFERDEIELERPEPNYFYSTATPYKWSSGPSFHPYDPEVGGKIASLERAKELAQKKQVVSTGDDRVDTTYGVSYNL